MATKKAATLTVHKLIKLLSELPGNLEVCVYSGNEELVPATDVVVRTGEYHPDSWKKKRNWLEVV